MMPAQTHQRTDRHASPSLDYNLTAAVCAEHITHLFASYKYPPTSHRSAWQVHLPAYITAVLQRASLDSAVALGAITLLFRYKDAKPRSVAYYDDAYRLFLAAYIVAAKVLVDPPVRCWEHIACGQFPPSELVKMEIELCRVLKWDVHIDGVAYAWVNRTVRCRGRMSERVNGDEMGDNEEEWDELDENPPPPSYQDAPHDRRILETCHSTSLPPVNVHESEEDRIAFARMLVASNVPQEPYTRPEADALTAASKKKSIIAFVKERIVRTVLRRLSSSI